MNITVTVDFRTTITRNSYWKTNPFNENISLKRFQFKVCSNNLLLSCAKVKELL